MFIGDVFFDISKFVGLKEENVTAKIKTGKKSIIKDGEVCLNFDITIIIPSEESPN